MKNMDRLQLNFRVKSNLRDAIHQEIARQNKRRDRFAERVWEHFLSLRPTERERICEKVPESEAA